MTPKEVAEKLIQKYYKIFQHTDTCFGDCDEEYEKGNCTDTGHGCGIWLRVAKQCAFLSLDEVENNTLSLLKYFNEDRSEFEAVELDFLQKVRNEIVSYEK